METAQYEAILNLLVRLSGEYRAADAVERDALLNQVAGVICALDAIFGIEIFRPELSLSPMLEAAAQIAGVAVNA